MHGNGRRRNVPLVDARSLRVECPQHPGVLLPVTQVKEVIVLGRMRLHLEALCVYCCDKYHYVEIEPSDLAELEASNT